MDNTPTTEDPGYGLVGAKLDAPKQRSPLADALQILDKSLSSLEMNIEALDIKLQPLQLKHEDPQRGEATTADRAPNSDFVNAILETAQRVNRNAQKVRKINADLEV